MEGFKATIEVNANPETQEKLTILFASEDTELSNNRASYSIERESQGIVFKINADDAVALRAITNAICKTLAVYEKVSDIK